VRKLAERPVGWETTVEHDGMWPFPWSWRVIKRGDRTALRSGGAISRERAQRKAIRARLSMEREDLRIVE